MDHINDDYKQRPSALSILPISHFIELKEVMMLSNIIDGRYDVDIQSFYHLKQSKKRGIPLYSQK